MVRILHTADWHLGRTLRGHSKPEKQQIVLLNRDEVEAARRSTRRMVEEALAHARTGGR